MKSGAVRGLSIGYRVQDYSVDRRTGVRSIKDVDLHEISLVTFPANDMAKVIEVKASNDNEALVVMLGMVEKAGSQLSSEVEVRELQLDVLHDVALWNVKSACRQFLVNLDGIGLKSGFNPDQARVPAGNPDGGQWLDEGGGDGGSAGDAGDGAGFSDSRGRGTDRLSSDAVMRNSGLGLGMARNDNGLFDDANSYQLADAGTNSYLNPVNPVQNDSSPRVAESRKYPKPKVGNVMQVPDQNGNIPDRINIFIGGAGDQGSNHSVEDSNSLHRDVAGNNYYYTNNLGDEIDQFIESLPTDSEINVIGHSWGGDTAARVVLDNPGRVNNLITVDPVTTFNFKPNFAKVKSSVNNWVGINAAGNPETGFVRGLLEGNLVAATGDWGDEIENYTDTFIDAPSNHTGYDAMIDYNEKGQLSARQILQQGKRLARK